MEATRRYLIWGIIYLALAVPAFGSEYDFDIPEAEKSNWEFGGRFEFKYVYHRIDDDSIVGRMKFPDGDMEGIDELRPLAEFNVGYNFGNVQLFLTTHHEYQKTYWESEWVNKVYEGYASFRPSAGFTLDIGKKSYLWGKGYAWNPVGFINRAKDPDDPELNLEGYTGISFDYIKSFTSGPLAAFALTPVILPVLEWENNDLGKQGDFNFALKTYFLLYDTDIDLIYYDGPNQPAQIGLDFSRNLKENFELHGELALKLDAEKTILALDGTRKTILEDQWSWLIGARYLTATDTTIIFEYYHNGAGYSADEIDDFFDFQEAAYQRYLTSGKKTQLNSAAKKANLYTSQRNYSRDYIYLKLSQKEPFGILDLTPYITAIVNLGDGSLSLSPGLTYQPWTNVEFGLKFVVPIGRGGTEYGEKQDDFRAEAVFRYYF